MNFRLQALVHQGEPDELDIVPHLVRPRALIAAGVLAAVIIGAIVWAFVGQLPRRVSAEGILSPDTGLSTVESVASGVVQKVNVSSAQPVAVGQPVAAVMDSSGKITNVISPFAGQVITVSVTPGQQLQQGTPVLTVRLNGAGSNGLHAVLFVPSSKAAEIGPGMPVQMEVDVVPSAAFGLLRGHVSSVDPFPVTSGQAQALIGNDLVSQTLVRGGPMRLVTVKLDPDNTASGYAWTTKGGPPFPLLPQSTLNGTVRVSSEHPITFVFGR